MKKINNFIKKNLLFIIVLILFLMHTVAYSALSTTMNISGQAYARVESDIRITDFKINTTTNDAISSYEEFNKNMIKANITLPNETSTITYKIEVTNYTTNPEGIYSITGLPENLTYELTDYQLKENICDGECIAGTNKEFYITIKYASYNETTTYDINLNFEFKEMYKVTYVGLTNNNFPSHIMKNETLNITTLETQYYLQVKKNGSYLNYNSYTYENGNLIVENITGPVEISQTNTLNVYKYSGETKTFTVPYTGTYQIELWGASGGDMGSYAGGNGGYTSGNIYLEEGTVLYINVGEQGSTTSTSFNGSGTANATGYGTSGGDSTDVRITSNNILSRIMVAGGGGGASLRGEDYGEGAGGAAGGLTAYDGVSVNNTKEYGYGFGYGGTQTEPGLFYWQDTGSGHRETGTHTTVMSGKEYYIAGKFLYGGNGASGGGSGYYGGAGSFHGGAGGGSSFISGHEGCDAIDETSTVDNIVHTGQSIHYSNYSFTSTSIIDGKGYSWTTTKSSGTTGMPTFNGKSTTLGNDGDGFAKISIISTDVIEDASGNNNQSVSSNVTITEEGAEFDGTDSNMTLPDNLDLTFPLTYALRVKFNSDTISQIVFGEYNTKTAFGIRTSRSGYVMNLGDASSSVNEFSASSLVLNEFNTYVIVYNSLKDIVLYKDGESLSKLDRTNHWTWTSSSSFIGQRDAGTNNFDGAIEYFIIYDKALTTEEIAQINSATDKSDMPTDQIKLFYYFK